ncbi:MAG: methylcobamide--CoM methyltransferase [Dehalococcoidia bacterium]|nr:methylcobamide--CoM methyltransferase [Dehalococcoidia bacterium]
MITTVVGNYPKVPNRPRPARLRNALNRLDRGAMTIDEIRQIQDEVTKEVIDEQIEAGVQLITDGQIRWDDEMTYFARGLNGVSLNGLFRYFDTNTYFRQPVIEGAIGWQGPVTVRDWEFASAYSSRPVKAVLPGPYTLARASIDRHYGESMEDLADAFARAVNEEAKALTAAGAPAIQVNEPFLTAHKEDVTIARRAIDVAFDGVSAEKHLALYFGDVEGILGALVDCNADVIGLDFVMGPANFDAIRSVSLGQKLCAGLIDARNTRMETREGLGTSVKRITEAISADRLLLSPNMGLEFLPRERAQEKLKLMTTTAAALEEVPA